MRKYETIVIVDPDISDEKRDSFFEKINTLIPQEGGLLIEADEWGTRKLAYEIKKKVRGNYTCLLYCGTGALVNELERSFQIDDRALKYMTVLLDKDIDIEKIKAEMAAAEAEEESSEETSDESSEESSSDDETTSETPAPEPSQDSEPETMTQESEVAAQPESNEEEK